MSFITRITVPISNYYRDSIFESQLYFECENKSPTKEQVIKSLEDSLKENEQYYKDEGIEANDTDASEILEMVKSVNDWSYVSPTNLINTNTFVEHSQFGKQPFSWAVITPVKI